MIIRSKVQGVCKVIFNSYNFFNEFKSLKEWKSFQFTHIQKKTSSFTNVIESRIDHYVINDMTQVKLPLHIKQILEIQELE